ncbi:reverse transcriptase domain-containing protein [Tanacetum coccineum]
MAEENVPTPAPTRTNEQILPAFIASANVPTIYIQLFRNTLTHDAKSKALEITPEDSDHPFVSPPAGEHVMDFMNELGYSEEIHFVSKMHVNNLYQSWRAILSLINQYLTGKTSSNDKPKHPVLQMLWGIVTRTNVDYAEILWEEFVQAIQIFFTHHANLNNSTKKLTPHVIPYYQFTKLIIYYLGSRHNIHRRPESANHITGDDFLLGNLKFVPKGEKDEQYLEMIACKSTAKEGGQKKTTPEVDKPKKSTHVKKPAPAKQTKPGKSSLQLVDEPNEEPQPAPEPQIEDDEYNLQRGVTQSLPVVEGNGKGIATDKQVAQSLLELQQPKGKSITDPYIFQRRALVIEEASTGPLTQHEDDTSANIVHDTPSPQDAETGAKAKMSDSEGDIKILNVGEEKGKDVSDTMDLEERTVELDEGHARSDPSNTLESRPLSNEDQAMVYPKFHESLKHTTEEHVFLENPPGSSGTLSSMKNLDDAFTYDDQFLYDKPTEEEPGKANVETEVESDNAQIIHVFGGVIYSFIIISRKLSILNSRKYLQVHLKTSLSAPYLEIVRKTRAFSQHENESLENLKPTKISVRLADRSFQYPVGIAENMLVEVGKFTFPADFVILEIEEDSKVPLTLGRPFLHTDNAVIQVKQKQLNLGVRTERMIFNIDSAIKHSYSNDDTCFSIDVIDEILVEDFDALLDEGSKILHSIKGTVLEEEILFDFDKFIAMTADEIYDSESDIEEPPFEKITINTDYKIKTSLEEPPTDIELKPLPDNLEYVFLEEPSFLPEAFSWKTTDIPGICPSFYKHKIQLLDDKKPVVQKQRRLNPNMQEVVKKEIVKLLDTGIIYPITDSPWVSPIHCVPKKCGITVITNENDELVPTRTVMGWRVCIDYRNLNEATKKDHFPLPFIDQMLERLTGNKYFCFLDGFSGYFKIPIDPND